MLPVLAHDFAVMEANGSAERDECTPLRVKDIAEVDFQPNMQPSVPNPFPEPIDIGQAVNRHGRFTYNAAHGFAALLGFLDLHLTGEETSIRLDVTGLGPSNNPNFNDLDLFLYDQNGHLLALADKGLSGPIPVDSGGAGAGHLCNRGSDLLY